MSERYERADLVEPKPPYGVDPDAPTPADGTRLTLVPPPPPRERWEAARAQSPVKAAWREGKPHPLAVSEWLWIVATAPESRDGWWPVIAFRVYAGFGTVAPLQSTALATVEDWQPVVPGTPAGEKALEVIRKVIETGVRGVDPEHEARFFTLSRKTAP